MRLLVLLMWILYELHRLHSSWGRQWNTSECHLPHRKVGHGCRGAQNAQRQFHFPRVEIVLKDISTEVRPRLHGGRPERVIKHILWMATSTDRDGARSRIRCQDTGCPLGGRKRALLEALHLNSVEHGCRKIVTQDVRAQMKAVVQVCVFACVYIHVCVFR